MLDKDMFPDPKNLPDPQVHRTHPFKDPKNHEKLLQYCLKRLEFADITRQALLLKYQQIDLDVSAYLKLSEEDIQRRQDQLAGKSIKPTDQVLPLLMTHLDDAMTYFMQVFAPQSGMYKAVAKKDEQTIANAFAALMNEHAGERGHLRQLLMFFYNCMKYNLGAITTEWIQQVETEINNDPNGGSQPVFTPGIVWQGNEIKALDMYNVLWDPSVHPVDCHSMGEFCAFINAVTPFRLYKMAIDGKIFNVKGFLEDDFAPVTDAKRFYRQPPDLSDQYVGLGTGLDSQEAGAINWMSILSEGRVGSVGSGIEIVNIMIHLDPSQFGLLAANEAKGFKGLQTWRISIMNGNWIVKTDRLTNAHGRLPVNFGAPLEDKELGLNQKSVAEILAPLQTFASFKINTHVKAERKNIWGLTVYDPSIVDLGALKEGDAAWKVAMKPEGYGKDIRTAIWQNTDRLDTKDTLTELAQIVDLMQLIWPTAANPQQLASMERAIESQVGNVVLGVNRRLFKVAKLIDDQALRPSRHMQHFNILQFQPQVTLITDTGEEVEIDPAQFRDANIRLTLGHGLASLDKFTLQQQMQRLVNSIIQSQQASLQFDLPSLLDGMSELMDAKLDLSQYRAQVPVQNQQPGQQGAEAAAAQTGGAG